MPLKIRYIPKATRDVIARATPPSVLVNSIVKAQPKFSLQPAFVQQMLKPLAEENAEKNTTLVENAEKPTGFAFPLGGTEQLPFHIARTEGGNLPVYVDYRYKKIANFLTLFL